MFRGRLDQAPQQWRSECHLPGFFCLFFHPAILDLVSYILGTQDLRLYPNYTCRPKLPGRHMDEVLWHTDAGYTYFGPSADPTQADSRDASKLTESLVSRMAESCPRRDYVSDGLQRCLRRVSNMPHFDHVAKQQMPDGCGVAVWRPS